MFGFSWCKFTSSNPEAINLVIIILLFLNWLVISHIIVAAPYIEELVSGHYK